MVFPRLQGFLSFRGVFSSLFLILLCAVFVTGCGKMSSEAELEDFSVVLTMGRYLWSTDQRTVSLVGVHIPGPADPNFHEESFAQYSKMLQKMTVKVKTVEKKHGSGYPYVDLVEVFIAGENINHYLLKNGMAFFNEDHWNKKEKKYYQQLEAEARENKLGVWSDPENLKVLFVRPKNGRFVHYPGCPHVRDLRPDEIVEYYAPVPNTPFMAIRNAYFCDYCRPKFEAKLQEVKDNLKVRLDS